MTTDNEALKLGIVPLRPLRIGDMISGVGEALRRNPAALWGTAAVVAITVELVTVGLVVLVLGGLPEPLPMTITDFAQLRPYLLAMSIGSGVTALAGLLLTAVANVVTPRAVFGHTTSLGEAWRRALPTLPKLLGVVLAVALMGGGILAVGVMAMFFGGSAGVLILLPAIAAVVYVAVSVSFASSIVVVEGLGVIEALRRSHMLVRAGGWWRVLGVLALSAVFSGIVSEILGALFTLVSGGSTLATSLATVVATVAVAPAVATLTSVLYIDHRCRTEGIEGLWRSAG